MSELKLLEEIVETLINHDEDCMCEKCIDKQTALEIIEKLSKGKQQPYLDDVIKLFLTPEHCQNVHSHFFHNDKGYSDIDWTHFRDTLIAKI